MSRSPRFHFIGLLFSRRSVLPLALSIGCGVADSSSSARPVFGPPDTLSRATAVGAAPMFAVSPNGNEAAAWVSAPGGGTEGRLNVAVDDGTPTVLTDSLGPVEAHGESPPKLAYGPDGSLNAIYVVPKVLPGRRFPLTALRFVRSTDDGAHWSAPVTVTDDSVFGSHNFHALHSSRDGTLYVSWLDSRTGHSAAFLTRSTDGGKTWSRNVRADMGEACPCCRTGLATGPGGELYMSWREVFPGNVRDVVVARSDDKGDTWGAPVRVHADNWVFDACPHAGPSIQVDAKGTLHVAWWTGKLKAAGAYYARSTDGGKTFSDPIALGVADFSQPAHVQLSLGGDSMVVVAWDDGTKVMPRVVARISGDGGRTFGPMRALSADGRAAMFPVVGVSKRGLAIAWTEEMMTPEEAKAKTGAGHQHGTVGLTPVGQGQVIVRRGAMR